MNPDDRYVAEQRRVRPGQSWRIGDVFLTFDKTGKGFTIIRKARDAFHRETPPFTDEEIDQITP